jgi:hypothetical protein
VDEVERHTREGVLDGARDVDRQRRRAPAAGARHVEHLADREHARSAAVGAVEQPLGLARAARSARRESLTAAEEREGASTRTRWPRAESSVVASRTNVLISCWASHGYGVTWAIEKRGAIGQQYARA